MSTIVACFVTMLVTAFFFSAVSLTKIKESDAEAAKWKALADYEAAEKHRALNDLNAERLAKQIAMTEAPVKNAAIDKPTAKEISAARYAAQSVGDLCDAPGDLCAHCNLDAEGKHTFRKGYCRGGEGGAEARVPNARAWLASHGLPVEEPKEAKA